MTSNISNNVVPVYNFQGRNEEQVPETVERLTFQPYIEVLPDDLCHRHGRLREVTLPIGLIKIGRWTFSQCEQLREIKNEIPRTVKVIGHDAFGSCERLTKVKCEKAQHQLETIEHAAFSHCKELKRIALPSMVSTIGDCVFWCTGLIEVNLSRTRITDISVCTFCHCIALQTASLPKTIRWIRRGAFKACFELVTVIVPLDAQLIRIDEEAFNCCKRLANFVLPVGSTVHESSFLNCDTLQRCLGTENADEILGHLTARFNGTTVHRLCYYPDETTPEEFRECLEKQDYSVVDEFGMTPFHVFFLICNPDMKFFHVLLDHYRYTDYQVINRKDANDNRPLDYLIRNWTDASIYMLQRTIQACMIHRLGHWGANNWGWTLNSMAGELSMEEDKEERARLLCQIHATMTKYEKMESLTILELALWKGKLESKTVTSIHNRGDCLCECGSVVVMRNVISFL